MDFLVRKGFLHITEPRVEFRDEAEQFGIFGQQVLPVAFNVRKLEPVPDQLMPSIGDGRDEIVVGTGKTDESG